MSPTTPHDRDHPRTISTYRASRRFAPTLGALRHIYHSRPAPWLYVGLAVAGWGGAAAFVVLVPESHGNAALLALPLFLCILGTFFAAYGIFNGARKHLIFDGGIVTGIFLPWGTLHAATWDTVDASTVRAHSHFDELRAMVSVNRELAYRSTSFSRFGVTFVGPSLTAPVSVKTADGDEEPAGAGESRRSVAAEPGRSDGDRVDSATADVNPAERELWVLGFHRDPTGFVVSLSETMAADPAAADAIRRAALPPTRLSGEPTDVGEQIPGAAETGSVRRERMARA